MPSENSIIVVISPKDFREEEYEITRQHLDEAGIAVNVASITAGECFGANGTIVEAELSIIDINPIDFSGIIFIGGPGTEMLLGDQSVLDLAKNFYESGKLVCAICWAPAILARSGILFGKKVTLWSGAREDAIQAGAMIMPEPVVADGTIITANSVDAADNFGDLIANTLIG